MIARCQRVQGRMVDSLPEQPPRQQRPTSGSTCGQPLAAPAASLWHRRGVLVGYGRHRQTAGRARSPATGTRRGCDRVAADDNRRHDAKTKMMRRTCERPLREQPLPNGVLFNGPLRNPGDSRALAPRARAPPRDQLGGDLHVSRQDGVFTAHLRWRRLGVC